MTFHGIGYYGILIVLGALVLLTLLPDGSPAHRAVARALLAALLLTAAIVGLSY